MNETRVSDVMTHLVVTLRPHDTIPDAANCLLTNRISGAPVVDGGRLVGVVSEADLVRAFTPETNRGSLPTPLLFLLVRGIPRPEARYSTVGEVMTTEVVTIGPDDSIWEAARRIDRHGVRRLPVVDAQNYVVGVLARSDLVRAMTRSDDDLVSDVQTAVSVVGEETLSDLKIEAFKGEVRVSGTADRKSTHDIALRAASRVPGVLSVVDELRWQWDDTDITPAGTPRDSHEIGPDPWAVGPLVKEQVG